MSNLNRIVVLLGLFQVLTHVKSDGQIFNQKEGDFIVGVSTNYLSVENFDPVVPVGVNYEYMFLSGLGVEGSVAATKDYFDFNMGLISHLILFPMRNSKNISLGLALICLPLMFERTSFHFPIAKGFEFVPYINLWRIRYQWKPQNDYSNNTFHLSSAGVKFKIKLGEKLSFSPYGEYQHVYNSERLKGWQSGATIGYSYKKKKVWR